MANTQEIVPTGPYKWFTRSEMLTEVEKYKAEVKRVSSRLVSSNINGELLTYGPRSDWSLAEWNWNIDCALALVSPGEFPYPPPMNAAVLVSR